MSGEASWWPDLAASVTGPAPVRRAAGPGDALAGTVFSLSRAEQLLLWSARRWRFGRFRWDQVEAEFHRLLPHSWRDALIAWEGVLEPLHLYPAAAPDIGNGCRSTLSLDERRLLSLVAVTQRQQSASAGLLLAQLAPPAWRRDIRPPLADLAALMAEADLWVPVPTGPPPSSLTLHVIESGRDCPYQ